MIQNEVVRNELNLELNKVNEIITDLESGIDRLSDKKAAVAMDRLLSAHKIKIDLLQALDSI